MRIYCIAQENQTGVLNQSKRGEMRVGDGRDIQKGGNLCIPMVDSCRFDRKQQNALKNYLSIK